MGPDIFVRRSGVRRSGGGRVSRRLIPAALLLAGFAVPARADVAITKMREAVVLSCRYDVERLCPAQKASDGRDMALCLKFSLSDLSLGCRHAVMDATRTPAGVQPAGVQPYGAPVGEAQPSSP